MKLAIVCGGPSSEMKAPFDDPEYEIWVLGNRSQNYTRYDRIFEIHDELDEHDPRYAQMLVDKNIPMVVGKAFPIEAEHLTVFPYDASVDLFGSQYLTSSPAMMVCYAVLKGYMHIELYGVDMAIDDHEYFWQRPCMEAWIGFAKGRGHDVIVHSASPLLKSKYVEGMSSGGKPDFSAAPFIEEDLLGLAKRHQDKITGLNTKIAGLQAQVHGNDGARQAYTHMARVARAVESGDEMKLDDTVVMR
jgi:hypothetical protein